MKYVDFFGHKVSKLIVGDNPFNGHSYITHIVPKQEMIDYHTEDKIFAGGQMLAEQEEAERRRRIKDTYDTIFNALKPNDLAVMGIFQKHHDQLTENVSVFNEWAK